MKPKLVIEELKLGEDSTSRPYLAKVFRLKGQSAGKRVLVTASVHGAEVQGNAVIWQLLNELSTLPFQGEFIFIPLANPRATSTKLGTMTLGRFNPVTGDNWNRLYIDLTKDLVDLNSFIDDHLQFEDEALIAAYKIWLKEKINHLQRERARYGTNENGHLQLQLQEIGVGCDYIFDLHTGPVATEYLYVPEYAKLSARDLEFPHQLIVPHLFAGAFDEASFMPWVNLVDQLKKRERELTIPVEAYTVELESEEKLCSNAAKSQAQKILSFLSFKGVIQKNIPKKNIQLHQAPLTQYKTYFAPQGGLVEYLIGPGDAFKKGDRLARILSFTKLDSLDQLDQCWRDVVAIEAGICINHYPSAVIGQGHELFQVMENPSVF